MSISAFAWERPVPQTQDFIKDGKTPQYIYNIDAKKFLIVANEGATRASATEMGYQWKIAITDEEGYYRSLTCHVEKGADGKDKGWLKMFCVDNASISVGSFGNNENTWTMDQVDDGVYQIGNAAFEDQYLGVGSAGTDTRLYFTSYFENQELEACYNWTSVSVEAYEEYLPKLEIYLAADSLGKRIDEVKEAYPDIEIPGAEAVYNNEDSSLEDLRAAYKYIDGVINANIPSAIIETEATDPSTKKRNKMVAENGMVVIYKNGIRYDMMGRKL